MRAPASVAVVGAVAQSDQVRASADLRHEPVVDRVLDDGPAAGRADLPRVDEGGGQRVVDGSLEVRVREHDVRALAAELQGDLLDVDRGAAHQGTTGVEAAGERDEVDVGAVGERLTDPRPRTEDEVDDSGGHARLLEQAGQVDGRERRHLGRLHDRGVARREGRRDLPAHLQQRVVPRPDEPADADRLVDDAAEHVRVARHRPGGRPPCRRGPRSSGRRARRRPCPSGSRASPCRC